MKDVTGMLLRLGLCLSVAGPLVACGGLGITDPGPLPDGPPPPGWTNAGPSIVAGDKLTFAAGGTIDMWPNCEETRAAQGYPNINCATVHHMGPDGTDLFPRAMSDYPMPGGKVMSLVGRIGDGPAFLVGHGTSLVADRSGILQLTANDPDWRKKDDSGAYAVAVRYPGGEKSLYVR